MGAVHRGASENGKLDKLVEEQSPVVLKPAERLASLSGDSMIFCGDGASRYRSLIEERSAWKIHSMDLYLASTIAELSAMHNSGPLLPLYVRKTDAEIALESAGRPNS